MSKLSIGILRSYTGQSDYGVLKGIWEWETSRNLTSGGIDYRLSPLYDFVEGNHLNYGNQRVSKEIQKYKQVTKSFQNRLNESSAIMDNRWWVKAITFIPRLLTKLISIVWSVASLLAK